MSYQRLLPHSEQQDATDSGSKSLPPASILTAIYRNIDENDSLLEFLMRGQDAPAVQAKEAAPVTTSVLQGRKTPKNETTVIEELQVNNRELRALVDQLITDLEDTRSENLQLRERVRELQVQLSSNVERGGYMADLGSNGLGVELISRDMPVVITHAGGDHPSTASDDQSLDMLCRSLSSAGSSKPEEDRLKLMSDSSQTSPYVFSPFGDDLSPISAPRELPPLAPLEMPPQFDFESLMPKFMDDKTGGDTDQKQSGDYE